MKVGDLIELPPQPPVGSVVEQGGMPLTRVLEGGWEFGKIDDPSELPVKWAIERGPAVSWSHVFQGGHPARVIRIGWPATPAE